MSEDMMEKVQQEIEYVDSTVNNDSILKIYLMASLPLPDPNVKKRGEVTTVMLRDIERTLKDPWTTLRQHLLHMFKVKNIRAMFRDDHTLELQILPNNYQHVGKLVDACKGGSLGAAISKLVISPVKHLVALKANVDEQKTGVVQRTIQRLSKKFSSNTGHVLGVSISKKLENGKDEYDFYKMLINCGENPQHILHNDLNLLHMAVLKCRPDIFKCIFFLNLLEGFRLQLAGTNAKEFVGYSPRGLSERLLLHKRNNPSTLEEYDRYENLWLTMPRLHRACLIGRFKCVQFLVDGGANVNEADCTNAPPLFYACAAGDLRIVQYLIDHGADPKLRNDRGENCLTAAAMFGKYVVIRLLLSRYDFRREEADHNRIRALDYCARNDDMESLEVFIEAGYPPDAKLVSVASRARRMMMVKTLLFGYNAPLRGRDNKGRNPLLNAVANGDIQMLQFLLSTEEKTLLSFHKSMMLDRDDENKNVFHIVAESGDETTCRYILGVMKWKRAAILALLDDHDLYTGRDHLMTIRGQAHEPRRAVYHVLRYKRTLAAALAYDLNVDDIHINKYGTIVNCGFGSNPPKDFLREMERVEINRRQLDMVPLAVAAYYNHTGVAKILLEHGASPNISDHFGNRPMHYSAMRGNDELVAKLKESGADAAAHNNDGNLAADVAYENYHVTLGIKLEDMADRPFQLDAEATKLGIVAVDPN